MTARILDGKALSERRRNLLAGRVRALAAHGVQPCLAAVTVRGDGGWTTYLKGQATACAQAGIRHRVIELPPQADQEALIEAVEALNLDPAVHGVIVQSPLPAGFEASAVQAMISPDKDVEGVGPANLGLVLAGRPALAPCTALAAFALAQEAFRELKGVETTVVGASTIVGKPLAQLLTNAGATVTLCQITTRDTAAHCRAADLLCVAVGRAGLVKPSWVKPGAAVIDIGINRIKGADGKAAVVGDVDPAVAEIAAALTPVPGGVGALTTTILLESTVTAAERLGAARPGIDPQALARLLGIDLPPAAAERLAMLLVARSGGGEAPQGPLAHLVAAGVAVLDGATGSELIARGVDPAQVARAALDRPDLVREIHRGYLDAGARLLTTATFGANRHRLRGDGDLAARIMAAGVRLAREVAAGRVPVVASLGPTGLTVGADLSASAAEAAFAEVLQAALDAGADGVAIETMPSSAEAAAALAAARRLRLPALVSRSLDHDDPQELAEFARVAEAGGALAVGINCAAGPRSLLPVVERLARLTALPILVRPNAGHPVRQAGRLVYHLRPAYLVEQGRAFVAAGATLIGGCCGVGPEHIRALAGALAGVPAAARSREAPAATGEPPAVARHPLLLAADAGRFPLLAWVPGRLAPADGAAALARLAVAGADAVGYASGWPGAARGARQVARLRHAADASGREAVLELIASDLALPAAQELLLSAHLLGIRLVVVDAGVFSAASSFDAAAGCDPIEVLRLAKALNRGRDLAGSHVAAPTAFTLGVRVRADDQHLDAYAAAGADFLCLQPVYEPARFRALMAGQLPPIPVFADVLLLPDAATAEELDNELPALAVPEALKTRLRADPGSDARGAGRFLAHWRGRLAGACVMCADGRTGPAETVIAQAQRNH